MKAMELLVIAKAQAEVATSDIDVLLTEAQDKKTVNQTLLYNALSRLSKANSALQSFECLVRTGEQPKSGE